jgi:fructose transport system permease protein
MAPSSPDRGKQQQVVSLVEEDVMTSGEQRPAQTITEYERVSKQGDSRVAAFDEDDDTPLRRLQHFLHSHPTAIPAIVLLLSVILFSVVAGGRFLHPFNLSLVLQQVTIIGFVAVAQSLIVLTAGIDLSVSAIMVLSAVVMGKFAVQLGVPVPLAFAAGLLVGVVCGLINGLLVTRLRLPPFIVTLGTLSIFFALNLWYSESETIRAQDIEVAAPFLQWTGTSFQLLGARITLGSILMLATFGLFWYVLNWTAYGRHIYAIGDDPDAARLAGISTDKLLLSVYVVAGLICAVAGWALIGRIGSVSPLASTVNLDSITAVVIGGISLFGGRGSILGPLMGALIVGVFRSGLSLSGLDVLWQDFTVGILIVVAVAIDQWLRKVSA